MSKPPKARRAHKKENVDSEENRVVQVSQQAGGWRMPAEWAPHAATCIAFPHKRGDWPGKADAVQWVFAEMARQLTRGERLRILVRDAQEAARA